uniref:TNFR-Cys domain-containing protein n=1 Tax=Pinguiococcus pyrenoidosus TaxID=172671 RepID=A0A7R9U537_9STRA
MGNSTGTRAPWACRSCPVGTFASNASITGATSEEEGCGGNCAAPVGEFWIPTETVGSRSYSEACEPVCEAGSYRGEDTAFYWIQSFTYDEAEASRRVDIPAGGVAVISPDGRHLYLVAGDGSGLLFFAIGEELEFIGEAVPGYQYDDIPYGVLTGVQTMVLSADGKHLYVAATPYNDGCVMLFHRDIEAGTLYYQGCVKDGLGTEGTFVDGLEGLAGLAMSPCGSHVYVPALHEDAISTFERDPHTGDLRYEGTVRNGDATAQGVIDGLEEVFDVAVAPDGRHLYALSGSSLTLTTFARNETTAALDFQGTYRNASRSRARKLLIGPSGRFVFVCLLGEQEVGELVVFARDARSGQLAPLSVLEDFEAQLPGPGLGSGSDSDSDSASASAVDHVVVADAATGYLQTIYAVVATTDERLLLVSAKVVLTDDGASRSANVIYVVSVNQESGALSIVSRFSDERQGHADGDADADLSRGSILLNPTADEVYVTPFMNGLSKFTHSSVPTKLILSDTLVSRSASELPEAALKGARGVAVTPCGRHAYLLALTSSSLSAFKRDSRGELSFLGIVSAAESSVDELSGPRALAVSPDGRHVYVVAYPESATGGEGSVLVFSRDKRSGQVSFSSALSEGDQSNGQTVRGLAGAGALAVSPDSKHVYVASSQPGGVSAFARDSNTGALSFVDAIQDGDELAGARVDGLGSASSIAISSDGLHVYVAAPDDDAVSFFTRDLSTGMLAFLGFLRNGNQGPGGETARGLAGAQSLAASLDGKHVYVAAPGDNAICVLGRDANSGSLSYLTSIHDGDNFDTSEYVVGLRSVGAVAISPDGSHVYTAACRNNAGVVFTRDDDSGNLMYTTAQYGGSPSRPGEACYWGISVSQDNRQVYYTDPAHDTLAVLGTFGECTSCPAGSFCEEGRTTKELCPAGKYQSAVGEACCRPCDEGRFQGQAGGVSCSTCEIGSFAPMSATECTTCPNGTYSDHLYIGAESECKACSPGRIAAVLHGATSVSCELCPSGRYSNEDLTECLACPQGRYSASTGLRSTDDCLSCPPGRHGLTGVENATSQEQSCEDCPGGRFRGFGQSECLACPPGRISEPGSAECALCPNGQHSDESGTACRDCDDGHFCVGGSETVCPANALPSDDQTYCVECIGCPAGTFLKQSCSESDNSSGRICASCVAGRYQAEVTHFERECHQCPPNAFCERGAARPGLCSTGTYLLPSVRDALVARNVADGQLFEEQACAGCKTGMQCRKRGLRLESVALDKGFYRAGPMSEEVLSCPNRDACIGGNATGDALCDAGHEGPYCSVCESGYFRTPTDECLGCHSLDATVSLVGACFVFLVVLLYVCLSRAYRPANVDSWEADQLEDAGRAVHEMELALTERVSSFDQPLPLSPLPLSPRPPPPPPPPPPPLVGAFSVADMTQTEDAVNAFLSAKTRLRIALSLVQLELLSVVSFDLARPSMFRRLVSFFDVLRLRFASGVTGACVAGAMDFSFTFYHELVFVTTIPLLCVFLLLAYKACVDSPRRWLQVDYACLVVTFLAVAPVTSVLLDTFLCETIETEVEGEEQSYLMADYSLRCGTPVHNRFIVYAAVMILAYPVGIPLLYAWLLLRPAKPPLKLSVSQILMWMRRLRSDFKVSPSKNHRTYSMARPGEDQRDLLAYAMPDLLETAADDYEYRRKSRKRERPQRSFFGTRFLVELWHRVTLGGLRRDRPFWSAGERRSPRPENFTQIAEQMKHHVAQSSFLTEPYQASYFYFEFIECARRLSVPVLSASFDRRRDFSSVAQLLASVVFLVIYLTVRPFRVSADSLVAIVSQCAVCGIFLADVAERSSAKYHKDRIAEEHHDIILLVLNVFVSAAVLVALLQFVWRRSSRSTQGRKGSPFRMTVVSSRSTTETPSEAKI